MKKQSKTEYRVYYGTDSNAALQPEYIPVPKREKRPEHKREQSIHAKEKAERKASVKLCARVVSVALCVAAMGFCVVMRNAEIYRNTREIRNLAKETVNLELKVRTAEKDFSAGSDLNSYFDTAENQLALAYPEDTNVILVTVPSESAEQTPDTQESVDVYDTVLDWISSLERRIRSWA